MNRMFPTLVIFSLCTLPIMAYADGTIVVSGSVPMACTIGVVATSSASSLDLSSGKTVVVGNVTENCNDPAGYSIRASSTNGGSLNSAVNASMKIPYTFSIESGSSNITLTTNPSTVRSVGAITSPVQNQVKSVSVSYASATNAMGGTYSDSITLTVVAN